MARIPLIRTFRDQVRFHAGNGGSWLAGLHLARARLYAHAQGWTLAWEDDDSHDPADLFEGPCCPNEGRMRHATKGRRGCTDHVVHGCVLRDRDGNVLQSLWAIIDADTAYQWQVEAELCLEAMDHEVDCNAALAL